jgi:5'-3' exonuclease
MKNYLIIDVSYLMYRSYFAYPNLVYQQMPVGAFFGFIKTVLALVGEFKPDELIFANDTSSPTWRHTAQTDYKAGRKPMEEKMKSQIPLIKDWCRVVSSNYLVLKGLEADDLIASSVINLQNSLQHIQASHQEITISQTEEFRENLGNQDKIIENKMAKNIEAKLVKDFNKMTNFLDFRAIYSQEITREITEEKTNLTILTTESVEITKKVAENFEKEIVKIVEKKPILENFETGKIFIFSKDRDLFQLLVFENVFFVDVNKGILESFGHSDFEKKYQLRPDQWLCYKTLVGDAGDNLAGVAGIGPKTATSILQIFDSVDNFLNFTNEGVAQIKDKKIQAEAAKLLKWQKIIEPEKINQIRELSSLCWIDLKLENNGFDLNKGIPDMTKCGFNSLITTLKKMGKNTENQTEDKTENQDMESLF